MTNDQMCYSSKLRA